MGEWRYYAQRATSGLWLDTNAQLSGVGLVWAESGPASAKALLPSGISSAVAEDGRPVWGKWDTILLAEEDGELAWAGICTAANPDEKGVSLEFIGPSGWLQHVDYSGSYSVWQTNVFDAVRHLIKHAMGKPDALQFILPAHDSMFSIGDPQPPAKPKPPARKKGQSASDWQSSDAYDQYQKNLETWNEKYGNYEKYEVLWYEGPFVGEELDTLAKETGFDYRERVKWRNRGALTYDFYLDLEDSLANRRTDIAFVDGMNLAKALDPKDGDDRFANRVIGLGAGEGRTMARVTAGQADGRLYQAEYVQYKSIKNLTRLRSLVQADHKVLNNKDPKIDSVTVWDVPGFASVSTLRVGDEVQVKSDNTSPAVDAWVHIKKITRDPQASIVVLTVEVVA